MAVWGAVGLAVSGALLVMLAGRTAKAAAAVGLLSIFFAYMVAPAARQLRLIVLRRRRRRLSPLAALGLVYAMCGTLAGLAWLLLGGRLLTQIRLFSDTVPRHVDQALALTGSLERWQDWFGWSRASTTALGGFALSLSDWVRLHVADVLIDALDYGWILPWLGLVPVLSFLLLTQFPWFRRSTLRVLPRGHLRWRGVEFLSQVNGVLAGYAWAQVLSSLIVGTVCVIGFALLGVPYALLLGSATGALELVPLIGPIAAALLVTGLVRGGRLLFVLVFLGMVRVAQDAFVYPRLMGRRVHLPPLFVLLAVWVGATVGGILGVLAAVPVVAVAAVALRQWRDYREIEGLVRDHERRRLADEEATYPTPSPPANP